MTVHFERPNLRDASVVPGVRFTKLLHEGQSVCVDGRQFFQCECGWTEEWWNREPVCGMEAAQARFVEQIETAAAEVLSEQQRGQYAAQELARARAGERR